MKSTGSMNRLLRIAGEHAAGLERLDRTTLRRGRLCVGCIEQDGAELVPVLGWVCSFCLEVLDVVWDVEIERTHRAREQLLAFIEQLDNRELPVAPCREQPFPARPPKGQIPQ